MKLSEMNPFLRFAELQPSVMSGAPLSCSYDFRIFYLMEGKSNLILSDKTIPLEAGMLLYFRPGTPYYFDGKVKVIVLNFDLTRNQADRPNPISPSKNVESFCQELVFENDPPEELADLILIQKAFEVENSLQECLLHYRFPTPCSDAFTSSILKNILCYIVQNNHKKQTELPELVQKIVLYIQQNYDHELNNEKIASELGYHSFYLNKIFKKHMGITIHQAVIHEKIQIAKHLLKETNLPINTIATEVGYSDRSQFCNAFKKYAKFTPLEYRKTASRF